MRHLRAGSSLLMVGLFLMGLITVVGTTSSEAATDYAVRTPILILDDGDFTPSNGVAYGHGTIDDPYVIEGWEINASTAHGIRVQDTTSYFVVRSVHVFDGRYFLDDFGAYDGISLYNVTNARIENVTAERCRYGISVFYSTDAIVAGALASYNNFSGICFHQSEHITASGNLASYNSNTGMSIGGCRNSTVEDNTVLDTGERGYSFTGIDVWQSENLSVVGNYLDGNGNSIMLENSPNSTVSGNTMVNDTGHAIYLYYTEDDTIFMNTVRNATQCLAIQGSGNNTLVHNNFYSSSVWSYDPGPNRFDDGYPSGGNYWSSYTGTDLYNGVGQDIQGRDGIADDPYQVSLGLVDRYPLMKPYHSVITITGDGGFTSANGVVRGSGTVLDPFVIEDWGISAASNDGIRVENTDAYFVVRNVTVLGNFSDSDGIVLNRADNGTILNCSVNDCRTGVSIVSSDNTALAGNNVSRCTYIGVYASFCQNLSIEGNRVSFASYLGIHIRGCQGVTLENNIFVGNAESAIRLEGTSDSHIIGNQFTYDNQGIECMDCSGIVAERNAFLANWFASIHIMDSTYVTVITNVISLNNVSGMIFRDSAYVTIENNSLTSIYGDGIDLFQCDRATVSGNAVDNVSQGIRLEGTSNSSIEENTIRNGSTCGLSLVGCSEIHIQWNTIENNSIGIKLSRCKDVSVVNNTVIGNDVQAEDDNRRENHWDDLSYFPNNESALLLLGAACAVGALIVVVSILVIRRKTRGIPPGP